MRSFTRKPSASVLRSVLLLLMILILVVTISEAAPAKKAVLITIQRLGDQGPVDLSYKGLQEGGRDFGFQTKVIEAREGEYEDAIRAMAEDGYDLIFATFPPMIDPVGRVAPDYPKTKFAIIVGDAPAKTTNVLGMLSKEQEGSFLVGVLAAKMTKTNHLGFVGGFDNPEINRFLAGFQAGARWVNPAIKVDRAYVGSFEDPAKGKELALSMFKGGADIVYHAAAKSGHGVFDAAKEVDKFAMGVDADQRPIDPAHIIASMQIHYDKWVYNTMKAVASGTFKPGTVWFDLKSGMLGISPMNDSIQGIKIPQDVQRAVKDAEAAVISGKVRVPDKP